MKLPEADGPTAAPNTTYKDLSCVSAISGKVIYVMCRASDLSSQRSSAVLLDGVKLPVADAPASAPDVTYKDLFLRFILLGWIAFGGPTAHIALFQKVLPSSRLRARTGGL